MSRRHPRSGYRVLKTPFPHSACTARARSAALPSIRQIPHEHVDMSRAFLWEHGAQAGASDSLRMRKANHREQARFAPHFGL